jgi:hypothetical protein
LNRSEGQLGESDRVLNVLVSKVGSEGPIPDGEGCHGFVATAFGLSRHTPTTVMCSLLADGYRGSGRDQLLVGSADTVVQRLRTYRQMGFDYVMVRHIVGDHQLMLRSFERIGRDVMPRIRPL